MRITFADIDAEETLRTVELDVIPRVGEFVVMADGREGDLRQGDGREYEVTAVRWMLDARDHTGAAVEVHLRPMSLNGGMRERS
ncbi:MAG TPA: hypothetical protein VI076_16970 [Actinopolymorphaceae bacterium]